MDIHKDCYSAIGLTQQDGPHRRETPIGLNFANQTYRPAFQLDVSGELNSASTAAVDRFGTT
jgi:hypothetical protein